LPENAHLNQEVREFALQNRMFYLADRAGTNIHVQIFDTAMFPLALLSPELPINHNIIEQEKPVILVMDYAFGEQAFEIAVRPRAFSKLSVNAHQEMDELLKPYKTGGQSQKLNVKSISVMRKAGILVGHKGDLMLPTAHIFEGTADNYPFLNELTSEDFKDDGIPIYEGALVTVMGTSLQNSDILAYFKSSSWNVIGLEMEGAHLQKAIQAVSMIRKSIDDKVKLRYAYYASDNPLLTGSTLASGGLEQVLSRPI